jgi:hypothetical protein
MSEENLWRARLHVLCVIKSGLFNRRLKIRLAWRGGQMIISVVVRARLEAGRDELAAVAGVAPMTIVHLAAGPNSHRV